MFVVGTETDHVAPWESVYEIDNLLRSDDFTFLLTSGGPNAGISAGPVHPKRRHRVRTRRLADPHLAPEDGMEAATLHEGSWWPAWRQWLWRPLQRQDPRRPPWATQARAIASSTARRASMCCNVDRERP